MVIPEIIVLADCLVKIEYVNSIFQRRCKSVIHDVSSLPAFLKIVLAFTSGDKTLPNYLSPFGNHWEASHQASRHRAESFADYVHN